MTDEEIQAWQAVIEQFLPIKFVEHGNWSFRASVEQRASVPDELPKYGIMLNSSNDFAKGNFGGGMELCDVCFTPYKGAKKRVMFKSVTQPFCWTTYPNTKVPIDQNEFLIYRDGVNFLYATGAAYVPIPRSSLNTDQIDLAVSLGMKLPVNGGPMDPGAPNLFLTQKAQDLVAKDVYQYQKFGRNEVTGTAAKNFEKDKPSTYAAFDTTGALQYEILAKFSVDNYQFWHVYRFYADGRMECGVTLCGKLAYNREFASHLHTLLFRFEIPPAPSKKPHVVATLQPFKSAMPQWPNAPFSWLPHFAWKRSSQPEAFSSDKVVAVRVLSPDSWDPIQVVTVGAPVFKEEWLPPLYAVKGLEFDTAESVQYQIMGANTDPVAHDFWINSPKNEEQAFGPGPWALAAMAAASLDDEAIFLGGTSEFKEPKKIVPPKFYDESGTVIWRALRHLHVPSPDDFPIMPPEPLSFVVRAVGTNPPDEPYLAYK